MTSFSNMLKEEILQKKPESRVEILSELYGIFLSKDAFKNDNIELRTEVKSTARRVFEDLRQLSNVYFQYSYISKKNNLFKIKVINNMVFDIDNLDENWILKGYYIGAGYLKDPNKGYSLDFFLDSIKGANILHDILIRKGKKSVIIEKRNTNIVYIRNMEEILDILIMLGATNTFFKYEEITINKEIVLKITRNINYELANETKKMINSDNQIKMIKEIESKKGLNILSDVLKQTAKARIEHEEYSLQQLADYLKISKSGLRNRFRRIKEVYDELKSEK